MGNTPLLIVEADERVDVALREQVPAQRRAALIGRETGGQHHADAAAGFRQRDRALEKQLIAVGVAVRLRGVDARIAREPNQRRTPPSATCARLSDEPASARTMSHGGLPITASKPASGSRRPSAPKKTSGNSSSQ